MLALDTIGGIHSDEDNAAIITYLTRFGNSRVLDITRVGHFDLLCVSARVSFLELIRGRRQSAGSPGGFST